MEWYSYLIYMLSMHIYTIVYIHYNIYMCVYVWRYEWKNSSDVIIYIIKGLPCGNYFTYNYIHLLEPYDVKV